MQGRATGMAARDAVTWMGAACFISSSLHSFRHHRIAELPCRDLQHGQDRTKAALSILKVVTQGVQRGQWVIPSPRRAVSACLAGSRAQSTFTTLVRVV